MPLDDDLDDASDKGRGCCGNEDDDDEGCCDEDCCNRTCCGGRVTCSLEAGFAATFAVISMGCTAYANFTCQYVELQGIGVNDNGEEISVAYMDRGIFNGQPWSNTTCMSWISLNSIYPSFIDPWWWTSMGCAAAALAFGFAALVQVAFLSCVPRESQRFAARCASAMAIIAAVFEGLTLLFLKSDAVKDETEWYFHDNVETTENSLHNSAWFAIASCAGWLITGFILCFLKNPQPDERGGPTNSSADASSHKESSHRGSERRTSTQDLDDEEGGADEEAVHVREAPAAPAAGVVAGAAAGAGMAAAFKQSESSGTVDKFEDALTGSVPQRLGSAEAPFSSELGSSGATPDGRTSSMREYYGESTAEDDFVDG